MQKIRLGRTELSVTKNGLVAHLIQRRKTEDEKKSFAKHMKAV